MGIKLGELGPGWEAMKKWHLGRVGKEDAIREGDWRGKHWDKWQSALVECGYLPHRAYGEQQYDDDELLRHLAIAARRWGKFPTEPQLRLYLKDVPQAPVLETFRRFGKGDGPVERLKQWVELNPDFNDIVPTLGKRRPAPQSRQPVAADGIDFLGYDPLSDIYVPPVVQGLVVLGRCEPSVKTACANRGVTVEVEFERRVAVAFRLLGLEVETWGQGQGRMPDGEAICGIERWAVTYDAKAYQGGYSFTTAEERKFEDYVASRVQPLRERGIEKRYFALVSTSFEPGAVTVALELQRKTKVIAFPLIQADALLTLIAWRLEAGTTFNAADIERLLNQTRVVTARMVDEAKAARAKARQGRIN